MILVSACLAGEKCRYDGKDNRIDYIEKLVKEGKAISVCPEILGGLSTPRIPAEIKKEKDAVMVVTRDGIEVTDNFKVGALKTLEIAKRNGTILVILKAKSPSCGKYSVYDGTFTGKLIEGKGITVELLEKNGIKVIDESEIEENFYENK